MKTTFDPRSPSAFRRRCPPRGNAVGRKYEPSRRPPVRPITAPPPEDTFWIGYRRLLGFILFIVIIVMIAAAG